MELADRLVGAARERQPEKMSARERLVVGASAAGFAAAAAAILIFIPVDRDVHPLLIAALAIGLAWISRAEFEIGSGFAVPDMLLVVPMLFLAPLAYVPLIVAAGFLLAWIPDFVTRKTHLDRWLHAVSGAWFSVGPVLVIYYLAPGDPELASLHIYALAFASAAALMTASTALTEVVGSGARLSDMLRALGWSLRIDAILWLVGFMAAVAAVEMPAVLLGIGPLVWLLSVFSRERRQRYAAALELNRAYRGTVMLLSDVVEADDNYTADHCRSVVELVSAVADEMEIHPDDRQELEFAALLHDVGKIAIPKEILNKPAKLTDDEFEVMKTHTIEGQHMLDRVGGLLGRVGAIVRSCHERWDGTGYPDGIGGENVPLAARIVFCCDAYNAMTTTRPYRKAMPMEAALTELREHAGAQFDPWVVAALVRVVERGVVESRPTPAEAVRALFAQHLPAGPEAPRP